MGDSNRLRIDCPHCGKRLGVAISAAGKRVRCPACTRSVAVPSAPKDEKESAGPGATRHLWPWLAGGGGGILVLAVGIAIWIAAGRKQPTGPDGGTEVVAGPSSPSGPTGPGPQKESPTPTAPESEPPKKDGPTPAGEPPLTPKPKDPLPGEKGARLEYDGKPTNPWAVYLSDAPRLPTGGPRAPWKQVFPSGAKSFQVGVVFSGEPNQVDVSVRLTSDAGEVKTTTEQEWIMINSTYIRQVYLRPKGDAFPDGAYQAEVFDRGSRIAVMNWRIGSD